MIVNKDCKFVRLRQAFGVGVVLFLLCQSLVCWSLNEEGKFFFVCLFQFLGLFVCWESGGKKDDLVMDMQDWRC